MAISPRNPLTDDPQARFFLAPESPQQRQYEALRAYFVEKAPSQEVARRFGYTPGAPHAIRPAHRPDGLEALGVVDQGLEVDHRRASRGSERSVAVIRLGAEFTPEMTPRVSTPWNPG